MTAEHILATIMVALPVGFFLGEQYRRMVEIHRRRRRRARNRLVVRQSLRSPW